jgi:uncharacterized membrane protein
MAAALADVALARYDRWYVAAHAWAPWVGDLVAAAVLSVTIVVIAGPIGRRLTPLDPRDRRAGPNTAS